MSLSHASAAASSAAPEKPVKAAEPVATYGPDRASTATAYRDLVAGIRHNEIWLTLGWQDIKQRYRRSKLGPFWLTISMGIMIGALGLIYSNLFGMDIRTYLPFLACGFIIWGLISASILEGCTAFIDARSVAREVRLPTSVHVLRVLWRTIIIFAHNLVIFFIVAVLFSVHISWATLLAPIGFALVCLNCTWMALFVALVCVRFRDIAQIVASGLQMMFFVTPVIWDAKRSASLAMLCLVNPFYHMVEAIRAPLLGNAPAPETWVVLIAMLLIGSIITFAAFRMLRWRVTYWA